MKVKLSFFMALLMLMMLMAFSPISRAACIPAPDPDLNNDGIVNNNDLVIVTRSNGLKAGHPRYNPMADTNCDGKINPTDIHYVNKALGQTFPIPPNINVTGRLDARDSISFRLGNNGGQEIMFALSSADRTPFSVRIAQSIQPSTGLVLSPVLNGTEVFDDDGDGYIGDNIGQAVSASVPGEYTITTTATVIGTTKTFTHTAHVKVYGVDEPFLSVSINIPGEFGHKLPVNTTQNILPIQVNVGGNDKSLVSQVKIKQLETGDIKILTPSQSGNPFDPGYSTQVQFDTTQAGRCYTYVALAETSKGTVQSKLSEQICVTSFPLSYVHPRPENLWKGLIADVFYANNLLLVKMKLGTTENRIKEIATLVSARIVGQSLYEPIYQFELLNPPSILKGLEDVAKALSQFPEVISIEAYGQSKALSSVVNDTLFMGGYQDNLTTMGAKEAWWVTGELPAPTIAVVDSGIASNHPDLFQKLLPGKDYLNIPNDSTTEDVHSHGSHVAGVAAAKTNNNEGIAGVSRQSAIIPVRVANYYKLAYHGDIADGIRWAAANGGKIINASIGVSADAGFIGSLWCGFHYEGQLTLCTVEEAIKSLCGAVDYAKDQNAIVIGASGNDGVDVKTYPGACQNAIAVGAVDKTDNKAKFSNFGEWVHLAAPGEGIWSTVPSDIRGSLAKPCWETGFYDCKTGTSQATPHVSGALAVLFSRHPEWQKNSETMKMAVERLQKTAKPLPEQSLGKGRIDLFEAVFNGGFEITDPEKTEEPVEWQQHPNISRICSSKTDTLGILPVATANNKRMLVCNNAGVQYDGIMNELDIPEGVDYLPITFDWRMLGEDLKADGKVNTTLVTICNYGYCNQLISPRDDRVLVRLYNLKTKEIIPVFDTRLTYLIKYGLVQASNNWYGNNWQTFPSPTDKPVLVKPGKYQLQVQIIQSGWNSTGDAITLQGSSLFMMDRVRFRLN
jgi:thermitase